MKSRIRFFIGKLTGKQNTVICISRTLKLEIVNGGYNDITTGMTVTLIEGGLAFVQKNAPEEEAQHAR